MAAIGSGSGNGRPKVPGGGSGDGLADSSVSGRAPATKRPRSAPSMTRAGNGSAAARLVSSATGSAAREPATTRLPNLRPRSTGASAIRHTRSNTVMTPATRARACASGGPSAMLTA
jgi:hypothetical protein